MAASERRTLLTIAPRPSDLATMVQLGRNAVLLCVPVLVSAQSKPPARTPPASIDDLPSDSGLGSACVDVLTWPCWMVGNASAWNKADTGRFTLNELCENNAFTWAGAGADVPLSADVVGPTLRAKDACCICQPNTVGAPRPENPNNTVTVAAIRDARRPWGTLYDEANADYREFYNENSDIACEAPVYISYNTGTSDRFPMENSLRGYTWCDGSTCEAIGVTHVQRFNGPGYYLLDYFGDYDACLLATRPTEVIHEISHCEKQDDCGVARSPLCTGDPYYRDEEDEETARIEEEERAEEEMGQHMKYADEVEELEGERDEERIEARVSSCLAESGWSRQQCYAPPSLFPNPSCATVPGCEQKQLHRLADGTVCNACGAGVVCDNENDQFDEDGFLWLVEMEFIAIGVLYAIYGIGFVLVVRVCASPLFNTQLGVW